MKLETAFTKPPEKKLTFRIGSHSPKRWFSTGFMVGGIGKVDEGKHSLHDAVMIRPGEAFGHSMWIDPVFCTEVVSIGNATGEKGLKARFGHPNMCSEALGTFLGRWKGLKIGPDAKVVSDLFLSSTAAESPKGDLRNYVEALAAKEPEHFGASIVFTRDFEREADFIVANGGEYVFGKYGCDFVEIGRTKKREEIPEGMDWYVSMQAFKSPDPANVKNLPHARCSELHAADLVDDPAATDGMFSGLGGASLAAQMTEWLDLHPQVLQALNEDPALVDIVERYADQLKPFLARYAAGSKGDLPVAPTISLTADSTLPAAPAQPAAGPTPAPAPLSTPAAEPAAVTPPAESARVIELEAALSSKQAEIETLKTQLAEAQKAQLHNIEQLKVSQAAFAESETRAALAKADLAKAKEAQKTAESARLDAEQKLNAIVAGATPVSATPAEINNTTAIDPWRKAQGKKK